MIIFGIDIDIGVLIVIILLIILIAVILWYFKPEKKKVKKKDVVNVKTDKKIFFITKDKIVSKEDIDKGKFYYQAVHRNYLTTRSFLRRLIHWWKKRKLHRYILIRMQMLNNSVIEFYMPMDSKGFYFKDRHYIFDDTNKYYLASSGLWVYDYHESIDIPVKVKETLPNAIKEYLVEHEKAMKKSKNLKIDTEHISDILEQSQLTQVNSSLNPTTLRAYLKSNFIQGLVQGASIGRVFRLILMLVMIVGFVSLINLGINLWDSGLISQATEGFKK